MNANRIVSPMKLRRVSWLVLGTLALGGCFDDGSGVVVIMGTVVRGQIEETAADATTVEAIEVGLDGSLETLVVADVDAAASYRLDEVPAERTGLQVIAYASDGAEVGRVQIHGETEAHGEIAVAPIGPETTVEGHVAAQLRASGQTVPAASTGGVSLFVRTGAGEAVAMVASGAAVTLVAEAFAAWHTYGDAAAGEVVDEYEGDTRVRLLTEAATAFAASRHEGTGLVTAHDALEEAGLDAGSEAGLDAEALVLVTAAEATGSAAAVAGADDADDGVTAARLTVARQVVRLNLRARERLANSVVDAAPGASASGAVTALASARADVDAATTIADIVTVLEEAAAACEAAVFDGIVSVTGELDTALEQQVRASLATALTEADLAVRLAAATNADEAAAALADYRAAVDAAVETLLLLPPATIDAEAVASLLIAGNGNGALFAP